MIVNDILISNTRVREQSLFSSPLYVTSMSGLGAACQINTTDFYGLDGSQINSERVGNRTISLEVKNFGRTYSSHNEWIYELFPPSEDISLIIRGTNSNGSQKISRRITGRISKIEPSNFTEDDSYKIQLLCIDPYFHGETPCLINNYSQDPRLEFPLELPSERIWELSIFRNSPISILDNPGSIPVGINIIIRVKESLTGITFQLLDTKEYLGVNSLSLVEGDTLIINTQPGKKGITKISSSGIKTNLLGNLIQGSTFFQLPRGNNQRIMFTLYGSATQFVDITYEYDIYYLGA